MVSQCFHNSPILDTEEIMEWHRAAGSLTLACAMNEVDVTENPVNMLVLCNLLPVELWPPERH